MTTQQEQAEKIVDVVKQRYGRIAADGASCCGPSCCSGSDAVEEESSSLGRGYSKSQLDSAPSEADLGLGCGAPIEALELQEGETVLDLGSGGGLDAFLAARLVGSTGKVVGVDMTPEMIERSTRNATDGGYDNVEFRHGRLEELPVEAGTVDAITSNCVINLVPDKAAVFREAARVLKPGGRLVISDIVLDGRLPEAVEQSVLAYVGCVAGAMRRDDYFAAVKAAGLGGVEVLEDIDSLDKVGGKIPDDAQQILDEAGVALEDLAGKVHSVTFRAVKN